MMSSFLFSSTLTDSIQADIMKGKLADFKVDRIITFQGVTGDVGDDTDLAVISEGPTDQNTRFMNTNNNPLNNL